MPVTAPVHLDDRPEPVGSGKVACGDRARISFDRSPDQKRVAGILRGDRSDRADLHGARLHQGIEHLGGFVCLVYPKENYRTAIFHDEDGGQNQGRNIDNLPLDGFGLQPRSSGGAVIERHREASVEDGQPPQQGLAADGSAVVARKIGQ